MPRWLAFTGLTMLLWGGWGVLGKPLSAELPSWQVQVMSTAGLLPVIVALFLSPQLRRGAHRKRGCALAFAAGLIGSLGNVAYYQTLVLGGKASAVIPLTALYPLVTIILALIFLRERLNVVQGAGIGLSLAALWCFNVGSGAPWLSPWLAVALVPIALWGGSALLQKLATLHASAELATLAFLLGFVPVAVGAPLVQPMVWRLPGTTWLLLISLGLCFGLGNLTLIFAYGTGGHASIVTPLASLYSVVTIPLAMLLLGERVTRREALGIGLALIAVVALGWEAPPSPASPAPDGPDRRDGNL
jgi:transporter family protein